TLQPGAMTIGVGAWLGTIMLFNVWVLIWPNQKKLLGITPATDDEKAKAKSFAFMASRTNTLLSIPMIMCMTGHQHLLPF
ncbi:MAG: urate hydroxylase PuuD, partial [Gammaproteobacteria bacterium]